jgi:copper oxidase (laccase) domain-containing protein
LPSPPSNAPPVAPRRLRLETFAPLTAIDFGTHAFSLRTTDDTKAGNFERQLLHELNFTGYATAEQTHGNGVAVVTTPGRVPSVDALVTRQRGLPLVIRCADCAPVFLVDRRTPAIALIHSGKKGTQANVFGNALKHIHADFAFIGPSIGPCHYEMDLWSEIEKQLTGLEVHNPRICTACHLDRYFSYRAEHGQTGRMLAVLSLR